MTIVERLGVIIFLGVFGAVLLLEISLIVSYFGSRSGRNLSRPARTKMFFSKPAMVVHLLFLTEVICVLYGYFIEPYRLKVNAFSIETNKLTHTSIRIVQISDVHCDMKIRNEPRMIEIINSLDPDVIIFTGDCINYAGALSTFKQTMNSLHAKIAKLAVRGNVDVRYWSYLDLFGGSGFTLLDSNGVELQKDGEKFFVTGISYGRERYFRQLLEKVPMNTFSIFLYHYSDFVEDLAPYNVDLYLSGHTHGGQIALPLYGALTTLSKFGKKYEAGLYHVGRVTLYVNSGLGMEGGLAPRVRFWARPEIAVFDIKPKTPAQ